MGADAKKHDQRENDENEDINQLVSRIVSLVESSTSKMKAWELENGTPYVYNEEQLKLLDQLAKDFESMFGPKEEMPLVDESADEKSDFNVDESAVFDEFLKALKANGGNISPSLFKLHGTTILVLILKKEDPFTIIVADGRTTISYKNLPDFDHVFDDKASKVEKVWGGTYLATSSGYSQQAEDIVRFLNCAPKAEGITHAINSVEEYVMETYGQKFGAFKSSVCVVGANFCRIVGANLLPEVLEQGLEVLSFGYGGKEAINHLKKVKLQELQVFDSAVKHMNQAVAVSSIMNASVGGHSMIGKIKNEKVEIEKLRPHMCDIIARDYNVFKAYLKNSLLVYTLFTNSRKPSTEYRFKKYFQDHYPKCQVVTLRAKKRSKEYLQERYPNSKVVTLRAKQKCKEVCRLVTFCSRYQLATALRAFGRGEVEIGLGEKKKVCAQFKVPSAIAFKEIVASKKDLKRQERKAKKADLKREKSQGTKSK